MKTYILLSEKSWHDNLFQRLKENVEGNWIRIYTEEEFNKDNLVKLSPDKIFIPHWSHIINADIYKIFECIVFHMTDLPYGRGGSPLQNLIVRGITETKISAIKVAQGIDSGDVYLKRSLQLNGTAKSIFINAASIIEKMIQEIVKDNITPTPQEGEIVLFKRRTPQDGNLASLKSIKSVYDHIRMLDADSYPHAFLETEYLKFEFTRATLSGEIVSANVRISKK